MKDGVQAFFTLNGKRVGSELHAHAKSLPAVCLTCQGDTIQFKTCSFMYDVMTCVSQKQKDFELQVRAMPLIDMKQLVMQYLEQMGYSRTFAALKELPQVARKSISNEVPIDEIELLDTQA